MTRKEKEITRQVGFHLPISTIKEIKTEAADRDTSAGKVLEDAWRAYKAASKPRREAAPATSA